MNIKRWLNRPKIEIEEGALNSSGIAKVEVYDGGKLTRVRRVDEDSLISFCFTGSPGSAAISLDQLRGKTALRQIMLSNEKDYGSVCNRIFSAFTFHPHVRKASIMKAVFGAAGYEIRCKNIKQKDFADNLAFALDLDKFVASLILQLALFDKAYPWWQYFSPVETRSAEYPAGGSVPKWISCIPPAAVEVQRIDGREVLMLHPSRASGYFMGNSIPAQAIAAHNTPNVDILSDFPEEVRKQIREGKPIPLDDLRQFGVDYLSLHSFTRMPWEQEATPGLYSILTDLILVEICKDIDFGASAQTKAGIIKYSMGPEAGQIDELNKPPSELARKAVQAAVLRQENSPLPFMVTGNDFKVEWLIPPAELFSAEKYKSAMGRILDYLGIPMVFWPVGLIGGEAGSRAYAAAYIEVKPFRQEVFSLRGQVGRWLEKFFFRLSILNDIGKERLHASFDPNVLTEDSLILRKAQFAAQQGITSFTTQHDELGYDADYEVAQKKNELKNLPPKVLQPYVTGRPAGFGNPVGPPRQGEDPREPAQDNPRPSTMVNSVEELTMVEAELPDGGIEIEEKLVSANTETTRHFFKIPVVGIDNRNKFYKYRQQWWSKKKGIAAVFGITLAGDITVVSLHFLRSLWTLEDARKWMDEHGY